MIQLAERSLVELRLWRIDRMIHLRLTPLEDPPQPSACVHPRTHSPRSSGRRVESVVNGGGVHRRLRWLRWVDVLVLECLGYHDISWP